MEGTVKFFNKMKNFGFIEPDEGDEDVFVHRKQIKDEGDLEEGERVTFETEQGDKGIRAKDVEKIE